MTKIEPPTKEQCFALVRKMDEFYLRTKVNLTKNLEDLDNLKALFSDEYKAGDEKTEVREIVIPRLEELIQQSREEMALNRKQRDEYVALIKTWGFDYDS